MDVEEDVGGWGRACAIAACLFIDGLNPPPARYRPGSPGPAPIGRGYADEMDDEEVGEFGRYHDNDEMDDEEVGGRAARCFAIGACLFIDNLSPPPARYRPGSPGPAPIHRGYADVMDDEEVGGRVGRCIAIAACLFIKDLNPPPARYSPGSPGPAPIHRGYADEMDDEFTGHYKLPHQHHDPKGWPGHDEMEDDVYDEEAGQRWPGIGHGHMPGQGPSWPGNPNPPIGQFRL